MTDSSYKLKLAKDMYSIVGVCVKLRKVRSRGSAQFLTVFTIDFSFMLVESDTEMQGSTFICRKFSWTGTWNTCMVCILYIFMIYVPT
jgi:hypothetical protein